MILIEDQLRNHISNLETINSAIEQKANAAKTSSERVGLLKSLSYNYDRLIKLYEVYQTYEMAIQRYYSHTTDTINKKYGINLAALKNDKQDKTSVDFFRNLHNVLSNKSPEEISDLTTLETTEFDS
ncbi:hypothetical protein HN385_07795 [archaeon]|nr:hypothetical protein [archaeon]